jgi:uncharacterized membrane protein YvbJ
MKLCPNCGLLNNSINTHCTECGTAFKFKPYKPTTTKPKKSKPVKPAKPAAQQMDLWGDPKTKNMT